MSNNPCVDFNEYQVLAKGTALYPQVYSIIYPALGLGGEAGEVLDKLKKLIRDSNIHDRTPEWDQQISKELGDVLWYLANIASDLGLELGNIAEQNIAKLYDRKARGVLSGSGDDR